MADKTTMTAMVGKYDKFSYPQYIVKINGNVLDSKFTNKEITVELTATYEASYCFFLISNGFHLKGKDQITIDENLKRLVKLGNKVEISLGYYKAENKAIFTGYIDSVSVDYAKGEGILYTVECLDGKGIMMNSFHSETKKSLKKYSAAIEDILKKYSSIIKLNSNSIDKSDTEISVLIEQHNESDYAFVVRLAKSLGYGFYIENGTAVVQKIAEGDKNVVFQFDINEYVEEFKMHSSLKKQVSAVTIRSNNERKPSNPIEGKATSFQNIVQSGTVNAGAISKILTDRVSKTMIDYTVSSETEAKKRAEAQLAALYANTMEGSIKTPGIPDILPGKIIKVSGFGEGYDRKYYVTKVIHKIQNGNFTTQCQLEVNEL